MNQKNTIKRMAVFFNNKEDGDYLKTLDLSGTIISHMLIDETLIDVLRGLDCIALDFSHYATETYEKDLEQMFNNICDAPDSKVLFIGEKDETIYQTAIESGCVVDTI